MLSPRQELLLGKVVDLFAEAGQPAGSKALASDEQIAYGPQPDGITGVPLDRLEPRAAAR